MFPEERLVAPVGYLLRQSYEYVCMRQRLLTRTAHRSLRPHPDLSEDFVSSRTSGMSFLNTSIISCQTFFCNTSPSSPVRSRAGLHIISFASSPQGIRLCSIRLKRIMLPELAMTVKAQRRTTDQRPRSLLRCPEEQSKR